MPHRTNISFSLDKGPCKHLQYPHVTRPLSGRNEVALKRKSKCHISFFIAALLSALLLCACSKPTQKPEDGSTPVPSSGTAPSEKTSYTVIPLTSGEAVPIAACSYDLLHTVVTIQLYDSVDYDVLNGCFALIDRYEKLLSRTIEGSELYRLNHADSTSFTVSDETRDCIELSLYYSSLSSGALDVSIAPISALWDFASASHSSTVPPAEAISAALPLVDYTAVHLDGNTVTFGKPGMQLELGAVAKGFIADRVKAYLLEHDVNSAIINLGGNVLLIGEKPDGSAFNVGVQKPFENRDSVVVAISQLKDVSMVSSGIYERYFYDEEGNFYHHILDSKSGYPCENDLLQVTVVSKESGVGDALSTACFALGLEQGLALINSLDDVYAVFITSDGELHFSDGYLETFSTQIQ